MSNLVTWRQCDVFKPVLLVQQVLNWNLRINALFPSIFWIISDRFRSNFTVSMGIKYGHESCVTRNRKWWCWRGPATICLTYWRSFTPGAFSSWVISCFVIPLHIYIYIYIYIYIILRRICGNLCVSQTCGPPWTLTGIILSFFNIEPIYCTQNFRGKT
jgi:hypothetical protein